MPVAKSAGSEIFAGTINQDGAVEITTTKAANDTTLARIVRLVGDAQSKRSPSEQWVEKFARFYTPIVMAVAIAVMLLPPLAFGGSWSHWFYEGLVLLVIACPCALVISTPVSIVAALTSAARRGVLIKGGPFVEAPARLKAIAMDKTGTLTEGKPEVHTIVPLSGHDERELLEIAASVEMRSEHPLAKAVVRAAHQRGIRSVPAEDFQATKGKGAAATIGGKRIWLGSHRLLEERGQETPEMHERLEEMERDGSSAIVVGKDEHVCGLIGLADRIRDSAATSIQEMRDAGIEWVVMLTGDNRGTGEAIGRQAGVDEVRAELLPADKVQAVEELVNRYGRVAMVGDGVNDAPAMARATLGIAMGVAGTDAALETADIALMSDDLRGVAWLVKHSRRTLVIIRQNIFTALGVKLVFVVMTLAGVASLWAAIAADMGASLLVIFNGLRLLQSGERSPCRESENLECRHC
jgi:Cd2+/Zn2+-exporting ATPase